MTRQLRERIQSVLTPDLLKKGQLALVTGFHPTEQHCAVASEAAYHLLGGKAAGWVPVVLPKAVLGNTTHWWLENRITGERLDATSEQFPFPVPYHLGKPCGFMCPIKGQPSKRAKIVIDRVKALEN